jgi:hypothetical protein
MVAVPEKLKKVPSNKEEWLTTMRGYFQTKANALGIWKHLQGLHPAFLGYKRKEIVKAKAQAWDFVYEIVDGTSLKPFLTPFENSFDAPAVWKKIVEFYEKDSSQNRYSQLFEKLNTIQVSQNSDLKIAFEEVVATIETYTTAINTIPGAELNQIDHKLQKGFLEKALMRCARFSEIVNNSQLDNSDYEIYKQNVVKAIDHQKRVAENVGKMATKESHLSSEKTEAPSALMTDASSKSLTIEEIKANIAFHSKNKNRYLRMIRNVNGNSNHPPNNNSPREQNFRGRGRGGFQGRNSSHHQQNQSSNQNENYYQNPNQNDGNHDQRNFGNRPQFFRGGRGGEGYRGRGNQFGSRGNGRGSGRGSGRGNGRGNGRPLGFPQYQDRAQQQQQQQQGQYQNQSYNQPNPPLPPGFPPQMSNNMTQIPMAPPFPLQYLPIFPTPTGEIQYT